MASSRLCCQFSETALLAGVDNGFWGWGTTLFDADNDGDLDIAATNGWFSGGWDTDQSKFFLNDGAQPARFADQSAAANFNDTYWGSALVAADFDRDGDLDLAQSCNGSGTQPHKIRLLDNQSTQSNNYLVVRPRMPGMNNRAIGAVISIEVGGRQMRRLISAGTRFMGQEPAEAFFGIGSATVIDHLAVLWPNGKTTQLKDIPANQVFDVAAPLFADGFESGDTSAWGTN